MCYCTVFALFCFEFKGSFQVQAPGGDLTGVSCVTSMGDLYLEGLIHKGAYFRNFAVCLISNNNPHHSARATKSLAHAMLQREIS